MKPTSKDSPPNHGPVVADGNTVDQPFAHLRPAGSAAKLPVTAHASPSGVLKQLCEERGLRTRPCSTSL